MVLESLKSSNINTKDLTIEPVGAKDFGPIWRLGFEEFSLLERKFGHTKSLASEEDLLRVLGSVYSVYPREVDAVEVRGDPNVRLRKFVSELLIIKRYNQQQEIQGLDKALDRSANSKLSYFDLFKEERKTG